MSFLEAALADQLITLDTVKSFVANSTFLGVTYWSVNNVVSQPYMYDLAL